MTEPDGPPRRLIEDISLEESINRYFEANDDWLSDCELPLCTQLRRLAFTLDVARYNPGAKMPGIIAQEFRQTFKDLHALRPADDAGDDEDFDSIVAGI